ncbi:putative lipid-binding transport protein (Tim44 family) [Pseudomonas sp. PvR086]|jgi:predicted lipid-binding transport protein (Tim44 family)|uniref:hypothetical protein n=1 Tax=Pseudomonas TaxID=286 RepID=UPI00036275EE|nr:MULTISPECIES: hypothetical protein [Pseudomonas]MBD9608557.1 hypothetical protein [Pseudomonas sp. PDM08]MDR7108313.1 putative lipid-binding transport protein (Tim44 family) [Pseudomonas frederiksbergensis]PMY55727.1 hypothetical protein C1X70_03485 [Pseudomonas sp. FW305-53]PMY87248.1 hypothetical protein C1X68_09100 [Pseudomonas sp. FW303-C2]PMY93996.1 hypothetical protein C1X67_06235 [Pseudomonas sp. FW305-62]
MKRSALAGLLLTATMLASSAYASNDSDQCVMKLQEVNSKLSSAATLDAATKGVVVTKAEQAKAAHASNNDRECVSLAQQALQDIQSHMNSH